MWLCVASISIFKVSLPCWKDHIYIWLCSFPLPKAKPQKVLNFSSVCHSSLKSALSTILAEWECLTNNGYSKISREVSLQPCVNFQFIQKWKMLMLPKFSNINFQQIYFTFPWPLRNFFKYRLCHVLENPFFKIYWLYTFFPDPTYLVIFDWFNEPSFDLPTAKFSLPHISCRTVQQADCLEEYGRSKHK